MTELHDLTMLEQAAAVRAGSVSPVELVDHYLGRIEAISDSIGAFVTVTPELAREAAKLAESTAGHEGTPALHGVPTAIKDLNLTAGVPTAFGTTSRAPVDVGIDDHVVSQLKRAGLISLGKTNTPEFGLPCYTEPDNAPPARTPWDLSRSAGGSSGGAAAAVAAGLIPAAQGSDGGGSIRIPASVCGLFGLKPSRGRVSNAPFGNDISGLGTSGPIARTVRDAAAMLDAMTGPADSDWHWAPPISSTSPFESLLAACEVAPGRLRIGRTIKPRIADVDVAPECIDAWDKASELLESLGHEVVDHTSTVPPELVEAFEVVWSVEANRLPLTEDEISKCRPLTQWLRQRGAGATAQDFYGALAAIRNAARLEIEATRHFDAVMMPTLAQPPALIGQIRDDADPAQDFANQKRFTPWTSSFNSTGQPAMSVPLHWTEAGLPIGMMFAGRPYGEATLVQLAAQLEAALPWADRKPPMW